MKNDKIPILKPSQFDEFIFQDWIAPVSVFYNTFHIEKIEAYKEHLKLPLQPHRRMVYFFFFIIEGQVIRSKGIQQFELGPGDFFFLPANQTTSIESVSPDTKGYYCHFTPELFSLSTISFERLSEFDFFKFNANPVVNIINQTPIINILERLDEISKSNNPTGLEIVPFYIIALFKEINLFLLPLKQLKKDATAILCQRYMNLLTEHVYNKISVKQLATLLSVSANHLNKSVKAITGHSAIDLQNDMRILEAKVLLKQTNLTISEIAHKIGEMNPSDFSRFFKSKTKITPIKYRNM